MSAIFEHRILLLIFAAVGLLAIVTAILSLFFAIGRRPAELCATDTPPIGDPRFLTALGGTVGAPAQKGGTIELLHNGDGFIPSLIQAIDGARASVNFMVYIWEPGELSKQVFAALDRAAARGVEIRVLMDGLGCMGAPSDALDRLTKSGCSVGWFRRPRFGKLTRFHKRNHRRAIVVDGAIGFTGGAAVGDKWLGDARTPAEWRDIMVRVTGPIAESLQSAFAELWAYCGGEILAGESFYPAPNGAGKSEVTHMHVASSPSSEEHPLLLFFAFTFLAARERIWITTPYFVPDLATRKILADRARDGVDVRILLPNEHTDAKPIRWTSQRYYEALLEAGVRIWEYQPTMLHTKAVVADRAWSVVGSANMDILSRELNEENVVGVLDETFGATLERTFERDLERSREIRLDEWRRRGFGARLLERVVALLEEQY
jgi:cardiolipin synthase